MRPILLCAALCSVALRPDLARADGFLQGVSGDIQTRYTVLSSKTTDSSGNTTKTDTTSYGGTLNLRLNHDLHPQLNLNASLLVEKDWSEISGDTSGDSERLRLLPSVWLRFRDPVIGAAVGYSRLEDTRKGSGGQETTLTRETYSTTLDWRPADLPEVHGRYTRTRTSDDPRRSVDTTEDYIYLKSEYEYRGLRTTYSGTYVRTENDISNVVSEQLTHGPTLLYSGTFFDGRVSVSTDNRVTFTRVENATELPLQPIAGLSSLDDTPQDEPSLAPNPALVDGDLTTSAGVNIGFPGPGGDLRRRNVGLDFLTPATLNRLEVWVNGWGPETLPADIATWFSWDVYISQDNITWTFHATVAPAVFGPFDRRFELNFPAVTTRYVKAVTRPLPGGVIGSTNSSLYPNIFITELRALVDRTAPEVKSSLNQTTQNYNGDVKVILLRLPLLYYRLAGSYYRFDSDAEARGQDRYVISNGLVLTHRFNPIFSTTNTATFDFGKEQEETRKAFLYYVSLAATPLSTLTSTLAGTGTIEWLGDARNETNGVTLYNTAQLYQGIDATLNVGATFRKSDPGEGETERSRDLNLTAGTGITPHRSLTLSAYYNGRFSHVSGGATGGSQDISDNRVDLGLSFTPLRTLFLAGSVSIGSRTGEDTRVLQNYTLTWAPFPDGRLQMSFYYSESYSPDQARTIQPSLRWYLGPTRRSYLQASYQYTTTESDFGDTRSHLLSTTLRIFF